jgi:uncharacterized membrane protein YfcA
MSLAIWGLRIAAFAAIIFILFMALFIAGFGMADNRSAWPHVQLLLLVVAAIAAIGFGERWLERLIRRSLRP